MTRYHTMGMSHATRKVACDQIESEPDDDRLRSLFCNGLLTNTYGNASPGRHGFSLIDFLLFGTVVGLRSKNADYF